MRIKDKETDELLDQLTSDDSERKLLKTIIELYERGEFESVLSFLENNDSLDDKWHKFFSSARMKDERDAARAVDFLGTAALKTDLRIGARLGAIRALSRMRDARAIPVLENCFSDERLSDEALDSLIAIANDKLTPTNVRLEAIGSLGCIKCNRAQKALAKLSISDESSIHSAASLAILETRDIKSIEMMNRARMKKKLPSLVAFVIFNVVCVAVISFAINRIFGIHIAIPIVISSFAFALPIVAAYNGIGGVGREAFFTYVFTGLIMFPFLIIVVELNPSIISHVIAVILGLGIFVCALGFVAISAIRH